VLEDVFSDIMPDQLLNCGKTWYQASLLGPHCTS
jgi:hypothetical protein